MQARYGDVKTWIERLLKNYAVSRQAADDAAETLDVYLTHFVFRNNNGRDILELYVDTDKGITVGECAKLSRHILDLIETSPDVAALFNENLRLEVSSPDVSKPIRAPRQYVRNIGRKLRVKFLDELDEERVVEGRLKSAELRNDAPFIEVETQRKKKNAKSEGEPTLKIPLDRVREAIVQVEF